MTVSVLLLPRIVLAVPLVDISASICMLCFNFLYFTAILRPTNTPLAFIRFHINTKLLFSIMNYLIFLSLTPYFAFPNRPSTHCTVQSAGQSF